MTVPDPAHAERVQRLLEELRTLAEATPPPSDALRRASGAVRALSRFVVCAADDPRVLDPVARELESVIDRLPPVPGEGASRFQPDDTPPAEGRLVNARGTHPLAGRTNVVAPPIDLRLEGETVLGDVEFDVRFEGNVGWVHGGFVAAGFDLLLVATARLSGRAGPSGTLTVRFREPTPVGRPLRYEGCLDRVEGRKIFVRGRLTDRTGSRTLAEADGIVVARA